MYEHIINKMFMFLLSRVSVYNVIIKELIATNNLTIFEVRDIIWRGLLQNEKF